VQMKFEFWYAKQSEVNSPFPELAYMKMEKNLTFICQWLLCTSAKELN
jgi:hypothetical protein